MTDKPRLIEVAFPLMQTSLDSVHEKNVRHGHISTLHIWPARRPLAACRAALIATLLPDPGNKEERDKLLEKIENGREELFNLRFQKAIAQLDNHARLRTVRREIAQFETVLHMRQLATEAAFAVPAVAAALADKKWKANTRYLYEDSGWQVSFVDDSGNALAGALVNLNQKHPTTRRQRESKAEPQLVVSYDVAG